MTDHETRLPAWTSPVGLFLVLVCLSLAFFRGRLETSDEQLMAFTTQAIAERFSLTFEQEVYGQRFTGYGVGTPLAGLPAYWVEKLARGQGWLSRESISLFPLTNIVLLGLIGVLAAIPLGGDRRWLWMAGTVAISPLLAAAQTLYSDMLSAAALLAMAVALASLVDRPKAAVALAVAAGLMGILSRVSLLPLMALVITWGWVQGSDRRRLMAAGAGIAAGLLATMMQNKALRGGWLATGYVGQDFTTPLPTGLHGMLLSPERGLLIFFPIILIPLLRRRICSEGVRPWTPLAAAVTLFSLIFHAKFWTWHGGWTNGPRFLLPALALWLPPLADALGRQHRMTIPLRFATHLLVAWCGLISYIYLKHSAYEWWNLAWPLHRIESQWLSLPQMSLWQAWLEGVPLARARAPLSPVVAMSLLSASLVGLALGLFPLLHPWAMGVGRRRHEGEGRLLRGAPLPEMFAKPIFAGAAMVLLLLILTRELAGPRGFDHDVYPRIDVTHLLIDSAINPSTTFEGVFDFPLRGEVRFHLKSDWSYVLAIDEQEVMAQRGPTGPHLAQQSVSLEPGLHTISLRLLAPQNRPGNFLQLFWTWPGEGRYLAPVGGDYVSPRELTASERFFANLWRKKTIILGGLMALVLLLLAGHRRFSRSSSL